MANTTTPPAPRLNAARLVALRLERGLLQRDLAKRAGISVSMLCDMERGRRTGSPATRKALADALRVDVMDLHEGGTQ